MSGSQLSTDTAKSSGIPFQVGTSGEMILIPQGGDPMPGDGGSDEKWLGELLAILRRRQRLLFTVFAATVAVGAVLTLRERLTSPVYQGSFNLLVTDPITRSIDRDSSNLKDLALQSDDVRNTSVLIEVLQSPVLLQPISQKLNLSEYAIAPAISITDFTGDARRPASGVLNVSLQWNDPVEGQKILEAISADYLAFSLRHRREKLSQGLAFLDEQAPALQKTVVNLQEQLSSFRRRYSFLEPSKEGEAIQAQRQGFQDQLNRLRQSEAQLLGMASAVRAGKLKGPGPQDSGISADGTKTDLASGAASPLVMDLLEQEKQLAAAEASFTSSSPQVQSLRASVNQLRPLLQQRQMDSILADLAENRSQQAELERQDLQLSRRFATNPNLIKQYEAIQQRLEIARANFTSYIKTREDFRLEAAQRTEPWRIISPPVFGTSPVKPNLRRNLFLSIMLGGMAGVGAALLRDRFDHVFHRPQEVEDELALPLLGSLPFLPLERGLSKGQAAAGLEPEARVALNESLRNLFTSFRQLRADKAVRLIAMASTVDGEGKSMASALFAQTLADLGQRVLLVDADMRRPTLQLHLDVDNGEGLSNLLTDPTLLAEGVIQPISANLDLITAGPVPPDATKLLSSQWCSAVVEQIRALPGYDVVLFDTPPALKLSDALLLSEQLDGLLFLVSLQRVDRALPLKVLRRFRSSGVDVLGLLTNQVTKAIGSSGGSHGHGYSGGYSPEPSGPTKRGVSKLMRWLDERH